MPCKEPVLPDLGMLWHVQLRFRNANIAPDARNELVHAAEAHLRPAHARMGLEMCVHAYSADIITQVCMQHTELS